MNRKKYLLLMTTMIFLSIGLIILFKISDVKAYSSYRVQSNSYESSDSYQSSGQTTSSMCYGASSLGTILVNGNSIIGNSTFNNTQAYGVEDNVTISFLYENPNLISDSTSGWGLIGDTKTKAINDVSLSENVGYGIFVLQSSEEGQNWNTILTSGDFFNSSMYTVSGERGLYTTNDQEISKGIYFRTIIAYKLRHKKSSGSWLPWDNDKYEYRYCTEISTFFISKEASGVKFLDIITKQSIENGTCAYGFMIDSSSNGNLINVKKDNETEIQNVGNKRTFTEKGNYTITEFSKIFGKQFTYYMTITDGLNCIETNTLFSETKNDSGYTTENKVTQSSYSNGSYSNVKVCVNGNNRINKTNDGNIIGITGNTTYILMELKPNNLISGYRIVDDDWGKYENQSVNGTTTGEVKSGCLIIRKSYDDINYSETEGPYSNGLYTTDYQTSFGANGDVIIYIPKGEDILNGIYIEILYAFELYNDNTGQTINVCETHKFYLCSDELDAITFHNLSIDGNLDEILSDEDPTNLEVYKRAETLIDGSLTTNGFQIDKSLNPTVTVTIKRNGVNYIIPEDNKINEDGKYEIIIQSKTGTVKQMLIYVSKKTFKELYELYFSSSFLVGKRIYSEGEYPVYEGGLTSYHINKTADSLSPLWGTITNTSTGNVFDIVATDEINCLINEAGEYIVVLNTNNTFKNEASGDNQKFTFHFTIIENGTAPGPQINKQNLEKFNNTANASNLNPVYYGLTYSSAAKGNITLAFADKKTAREYAYQYEKGMVEVQSDGSYRYNGNLIVSQKVKYESNWDLTDAIYDFIDQAIQKLYFDMSDPFTYMTVSDDLLNSVSNIRTQELEKSVVIVASGELEKLIKTNSIYSINSKHYAIIEPGIGNDASYGYSEFKFIKDKYGYDSNTVTIIDSDGNRFNIEYNVSVEEQLKAYNFKTGIITIEEATIYGDTTTYTAVYIKEDDVTNTTCKLNYVDVYGNNQIININSEIGNDAIECYMFYLNEFVNQYDKYNLVLIEKDGKVIDCYSTSDDATTSFTEKGEYKVTIENRLGYKYSFNLNIKEQYYSTVSFSGDGTENLSTIVYRDNDSIQLQSLTRYGYNFKGYQTSDGNIYNEEITGILLKGTNILKAVWEAKKFKMTLIINGNVYKNFDVVYNKSYHLDDMSSEYENFLGWGDDELKDITISNEGDIVLHAKFKETPKKDEIEDNNTTSTVQQETNTTTNDNTSDVDSSSDFFSNYWFIFLVVIVIVIIVLAKIFV